MGTVNFPDVVSKPIKSAEHQKPYLPAQLLSTLWETIHPGTIQAHGTFSGCSWLRLRASSFKLARVPSEPPACRHQSQRRSSAAVGVNLITVHCYWVFFFL